MTYDVFISCKSEDYNLGDKVYKFLTTCGLNVFFSPRELKRMKESEYMDAIAEALDSAYHLIVVASKPEYVKSKWVKFEWSTFLGEQLSGRKQGQIITLLEGMKIGQLPIQLRHLESFGTDNFKDDLLSYVETPDYISRKEKERKKILEEEEKKRKEEENKKKREETRQEISQKENEYDRMLAHMKELASDLAKKKKEVGDNWKTCPVCNNKSSIEEEFCKVCGWTFYPTYAKKGAYSVKQLFIARSNWNSLNKKIEDSLKVDDYEKKIKEQKEIIRNLYQKIDDLENQKKIIEHACEQIQAELNLERSRSTQRGKTSQESNNQNSKKSSAKSARAKQHISNLTDVANVILSCCSTQKSIFGRDRLTDINFDVNKLIAVLRNGYEINISYNDLSECYTFDDVKKVVALKANVYRYDSPYQRD